MKFNLTLVKKLYKATPHSLTRILELLPFDFFCGKAYRRQMKAIEECSYEPASDKHIEALLDFANDVIKNVPYYIDFCNKNKISKLNDLGDFYSLPVISKEMLSNNLDLFADSRYRDKSYSVSTGGTTGNQLSFLMENEAFGKEWAFVNSYIREIGGNENDRRLCLRGVSGIEKDSLIGYNPLYKEMLISPFHLTEERIEKDIELIIKFKPKWIHGYPSSVALLAKHLLKLGRKIPSVEFVLLVSEKLYDEQCEIITSVFGYNIHTFYGMTERVIFAPFINNKFVPNPLYCLVEDINGELIGTGFVNRSFPLLRYKTGDAAITTKASNGIVTSMSEILGRWGKEFLIGASGVHISMTALNVHCGALTSVDKFQFVQEKQGECFLNIVLNEELDAKKINDILSAFQNKVGSELLIQIRIVERIELSKRGKHVFIINKIMADKPRKE